MGYEIGIQYYGERLIDTSGGFLLYFCNSKVLSMFSCLLSRFEWMCGSTTTGGNHADVQNERLPPPDLSDVRTDNQLPSASARTRPFRTVPWNDGSGGINLPRRAGRAGPRSLLPAFLIPFFRGAPLLHTFSPARTDGVPRPYRIVRDGPCPSSLPSPNPATRRREDEAVTTTSAPRGPPAPPLAKTNQHAKNK